MTSARFVSSSRSTAGRSSCGSAPTRELTATEKESLQKLLIEARRNEYVRKANEVRLYADMTAFPGGSSSGPSTSNPGGPGGFGAAVSGGNILLNDDAYDYLLKSFPSSFVSGLRKGKNRRFEYTIRYTFRIGRYEKAEESIK